MKTTNNSTVTTCTTCGYVSEPGYPIHPCNRKDCPYATQPASVAPVAGHTPGTRRTVTLSELLPVSLGDAWHGACNDYANCDIVSGDSTLCKVYGKTVERAKDGAEQIMNALNSAPTLARQVAELEAALTLTVPCLKVAEDGLRGWGLIPSADACVRALAKARDALANKTV